MASLNFLLIGASGKLLIGAPDDAFGIGVLLGLEPTPPDRTVVGEVVSRVVSGDVQSRTASPE